MCSMTRSTTRAAPTFTGSASGCSTAAAERDLADAVADVPEWANRLEVVALDFGDVSAN